MLLLGILGLLVLCKGVVLQLGGGLSGTRVGERLQELILAVDSTAIVNGTDGECSHAVDLCLSFGDTTFVSQFIPKQNLSALGAEGTAIFKSTTQSGGILVAATGNPVAPAMEDVLVTRGSDVVDFYGGDSQILSKVGPPWTFGPAARKSWDGLNLGAAHASYLVLEMLGYGFLHPLRPSVPSSFRAVKATHTLETQSPRWAERVWHYHTEHPLELTDLLQGFDASRGGPGSNFSLVEKDEDDDGDDYHESWESMYWGMERFCEWLVANGQNTLEWVLLYGTSWGDAGLSDERLSRLANLTATAHSWGIAASADAPIVEEQQHGWFLSNATGNATVDTAELERSLSRIANLGFDALGTESGLSEFTNPGCVLMLWFINATARIGDEHGLRTGIKCHCSSGQFCPNFTDPITGGPLNFNLLPVYSDPRMGVLPHTVQEPTLFEDPVLVYGQANFSYIFDWIKYMSQQKKRTVVSHLETAYFINLDMTVPLATSPLYADRRLADLRYIAASEDAQGWRSTGYNDFTSGWEFGGFFADAIVARAAFSPVNVPKLSAGAPQSVIAAAVSSSQEVSMAEALESILTVMFNESAVASIAKTVARHAREDRAVWMFGNTSSTSPSPPPPDRIGKDTDYLYRLGRAYLVGFDSFAEIQQLFTDSSTQPFKWLLTDDIPISGPGPKGQPSFQDLHALLHAQATVAAQHLSDWSSFRSAALPSAQFLYNDMVTVLNLTALRAQQVASLYDAVWKGYSNATRQAALTSAKTATLAFADLANRHAANFAVPEARIASWRTNPTVYKFGYVWTARRAYYLWRDFAVASAVLNPPSDPASELFDLSPCYLNIINPAETALGDGTIQNLAQLIRDIADIIGNKDAEALLDCLAAPEHAPTLPPSDL